MISDKKHWSKQIASATYALEKEYFAAASFVGLWAVSIRTEQTNLQCTLVCTSLLCFYRKIMTDEYYL